LARPQRDVVGYLIFIDPLPPDFTSAELRALLEPFGGVVWARVIYDSVGESLRFGRAEMETAEAAENVCKHLNRAAFRGATLTVLREDKGGTESAG
jgi:RNA recognition motif-containing protein